MIDPLSAQVEVVKEATSGSVRQSHNAFTNQGSITDYEEFRQAGIISKKFSSNLGVTEGKGSMGSIGQINRDSILNQPKFNNSQISGGPHQRTVKNPQAKAKHERRQRVGG